jgi:hypothetical protein
MAFIKLLNILNVGAKRLLMLIYLVDDKPLSEVDIGFKK